MTSAKAHQWYALRVKGGREEKVKKAIQQSFADAEMADSLGVLHAPFQRVYGMRQGKQMLRKRFFGYLFVQVDLLAEAKEENKVARDLLLKISDVMGFVVEGKSYTRKGDPVPISQREMDRMLGQKEKSAQTKSTIEAEIKEGGEVEIISGAFKGKTVIVQKVNTHNKEIEVLLRIFNEERKVKLNYHQVKIK